MNRSGNSGIGIPIPSGIVPANGASTAPWERACTTAYLALVSLLLPTALHDTFHDATETKLVLFLSLSGLYLAALALIRIARCCTRNRARGETLLPSDAAFLLFAIVGIASAVLSGFAEEALLARDNRYQGILTFALYAVLAVSIRRFGCEIPVVCRTLLIAFAAVTALGVLCQMRLDPLGHLDALIVRDRARFTSTIGNIGFYGAYCVLLLPLPLVRLLEASGARQTALYATLTVLTLCGTMAARTESALLGLVAVAVLTPLFLSTRRALVRYLYALPLLLAAMALYGVAANIGRWYALSSLMRRLLAPMPYAILTVALLLLALLSSRMRDETFPRVKRRYGICLGVLMLAGLAAVLLINLRFADAVPPLVRHYAVISPDWGTDRGHIWRGMLAIERGFSPWQRLFGGGFGAVARWDAVNRLFPDARTDTAHNEYLQYLITHGLIGLLAYGTFLVLSIRRGMRGNADVRACALGCAAYAVQAAVNIAQPFTTPLFLLLLFAIPKRGATENALPAGRTGNIVLTGAAVLLISAALAIGVLCTT